MGKDIAKGTHDERQPLPEPLKVLQPFHGSYANRRGLWAPGKVCWSQEDGASLVGPRLYHDLILPHDRRIWASVAYAMEYTHSVGLRGIAELRRALDERSKLGHERVPVQVRFPNDGLEANLVAGLDIARWCEERLVDELAPSELHWLEEYRDFDDAPYIELGRRYGLPVTTSLSFNPVQKGKCGLCRGHNPVPLS